MFGVRLEEGECGKPKFHFTIMPTGYPALSPNCETPGCANTPHSYGPIGVVTMTSLSLSLGLAALVGASLSAQMTPFTYAEMDGDASPIS